METEIKAIIEKNLPAQVGDVLKERLEQAEKDAVRVKQLEEQLGSRNQHVTKLETTISDYQKFDERNAALELREKNVGDAERNLKVATLEFQLVAEKEKTEFTKSVALGLVRNTEYRRTMYDNQNEPYKDQYGNTMYQNKTQNSDETKKAE